MMTFKTDEVLIEPSGKPITIQDILHTGWQYPFAVYLLHLIGSYLSQIYPEVALTLNVTEIIGESNLKIGYLVWNKAPIL